MALSSLPAIQGSAMKKNRKAEKEIGCLGAIVAKSQAFDCHDPEVCGADIFQKLVPLVRRHHSFCFASAFFRMHI